VWNTVSPSYSAQYFNGQDISTQKQSDGAGYIAVSPDGTTIAYLSPSPIPLLCYYHNIDDVSFSFNIAGFSEMDIVENGLHFVNNNKIFYISTYDACIHYLKYEPDYCRNPAYLAYPFT
jgi:hypothetical protein